jgi:hypothetical protein
MESSAKPVGPATAQTARGERVVDLFDRVAGRISPTWLVYPALFVCDTVLSLLISNIRLIAGFPREHAVDWATSLVRRDILAGFMIAIVIVPIIENVLLWAVARGGRAFFRSSDVAIVLAAAVLAATHLPLDAPRLTAVFCSFLLQATVISSRRLPRPFLTAWGIHVAHNALLMALLLAAR